jgi:hypothetical protein
VKNILIKYETKQLLKSLIKDNAVAYFVIASLMKKTSLITLITVFNVRKILPANMRLG